MAPPVLLLLLLVAGALATEASPCHSFWYGFNGRFYRFVATEMSWADAELHCMSHKAHLVSIHSRGEDDFVRGLIRGFDTLERPTWIGLSDTHKEGSWMWTDGSDVNFTMWDTSQPDNYHGGENCATNNFADNKKWNDFGCSEQFQFVCASPAHCLPNVAV